MRQSDSDPSQPRALLGSNPSVRRLAPREREVALLIADGLENASIAQRLGVSSGMVRNYSQNIRRRLRLGSREEIAAWVTARRTPGNPDAPLRRIGVD